jgi:hypothetical protein
MKFKWIGIAIALVVGFLLLKWFVNQFQNQSVDLGGGSIYGGWPYAGSIYPRGTAVYPWPSNVWGGVPPARGGPKPWRGQSYARRG